MPLMVREVYGKDKTVKNAASSVGNAVIYNTDVEVIFMSGTRNGAGGTLTMPGGNDGAGMPEWHEVDVFNACGERFT